MQQDHCSYAAPRPFHWRHSIGPSAGGSKILASAARLLASAVIALAIVHLPSAGGMSSGLVQAQRASVSAGVVNRLKKGDRLVMVPAKVERIGSARAGAEAGADSDAATFAERFAVEPAPEPAPAKSQLTPNPGQSIPFGCDAAFSRILSSRNFAARCVTSVEPPVKLALAETH
jgi:hypothetical protein